MGRVARPLGRWPALVAGLCVLCTPLLLGLGRHFMPEGALVAACSLVVLALEGVRRRPAAWRYALLGCALGATLLIKQSAALCLLPVLALRLPRRAGSALALALAACLLLPWLGPRLAEQWSYGGQSVAAPPGVSPLRQLGFYPWSFFWVGAGPVLAVLGVAGTAAGLRARREGGPAWEITWVALAWGLGAFLLLLLVPRKYPRLMAPALPALGLLAAVLAARMRRPWWLGGGLVLALVWSAWGSLRAIPVPESALVMDERCPQRWFRPAVDDDLGLGAALEAVARARPGPVRVLGTVELPCELQSSFDWRAHLGPALRRAGLDRELLLDDAPGQAAVILSWQGAQPGWQGYELPVPALGETLWIGAAAR